MRTIASTFALILVFVALAAETQERVEPQEHSAAPIHVPACAKSASSGHKFIGWGKYGLRFSIPKYGAKVVRGKADVDYVLFVIKPNNGNGVLVLWFGMQTLTQKPEWDTLEDAASYTQAKLLDSEGATIGLDSRGKTHDDTRWRRFVIWAEGAVYDDVSVADAAFFDQIVESACLIPSPRS